LRAHGRTLLKLCLAGLLLSAGCGRIDYDALGGATRGMDAGADAALDVDGGGVDAGGVDAGAADAGETCPAGQWRDYVAGSCNVCPATPIDCLTGVDTTTATTFFDPPSGIFHIKLTSGLAQVVAGTLTLRLANAGGTIDVPVPITPAHDIVIASAAAVLSDPTITAIALVSLQLVDACGAVMDIPDFRAIMVVMPGMISATDFYCGS